MNERGDYRVEPWGLRETSLDLSVLAQSESLFALSNGNIGWRGNLDEGEPHGLHGSYVNGVHELRPLPYAEVGFGYPEQDEVAVNVTDGKIIRLLVDDEPFGVRYGTLTSHERFLDFRAGLLTRTIDWSTPKGKRVRITSARLVSFAQRSIGAISYEVEAVDEPVHLVVQSELVANEPAPPASNDPRDAAALDSPWRSLAFAGEGTWAELLHRTQFSALTVAAVMDHEIDGPPTAAVTNECFEDLARVTISVTLQPGERLRVVKYVAYGWSSEQTWEALRDQANAAMVAARARGFDALCDDQREYLEDFWRRADVEIDGDVEIQQAARFSLFHVLQAGARNERRAIPAKGLTGNGYDGHAFWDSETFVLQVLNFVAPEAVREALCWRHDTLPMAKDRAGQLRLKGAAFPWRTITGAECSSYWPAGTAAFHVTADISDAVVRYVHATGDVEFERAKGLELLVETARLWLAIGHYDFIGKFRIDGVTGPDEYSAVADNNIYTNLMVEQNLRAAADAVERYRAEAAALGVSEEEVAAWRAAAAVITIPFDERLGVHSQAERFTDHEFWDFEGTADEQYPLLLNFPYFDLYRKQVVKQADLVMAMFLRGDVFTTEQKRVNFDYYESLTVRDSSLSACSQAVMAAEVGHLSLAYDYLAEASLMDLDDLEHNTRDGLHVASLAGTWIALVAGLAGMRPWGESLRFAPQLPEGITRLAFNLVFRGRRLRIETTPTTTTYRVLEGDALELRHGFEAFTVPPGETVSLDRTLEAPPTAWPPPVQPRGRAPRHRVADALRDGATT
jgi:alpha,alpha-trehalose phosphorylase